MTRTTIDIKGMHCKACETLISEKLMELPGVKSAKVSLGSSQAEIESKYPLDSEKVQKAVEEAGYQVGKDDKKQWLSRTPGDYADLGLAFLLLVVLYLAGSKLGLFNLSLAGAQSPSGLFVVLLVGLTAGFSTCMALVGGLVLGISARHAEKHPEAGASQKFTPHLYFNLGRILSYFVLGGAIGAAGQVFQFSGTALGLLTMIVGLVMLFLGLKLIEIFPRFSSSSFALPASIGRFLGIKKHHNKEYSHLNSMLVGALTFFLPCGFTQAMQLYAMSTGSFWSGALIMAVFAIGTAPGLLGIGGLTSLIKGSFAKKFYKFAGLLVIFLALFNISNGFNLTGWTVDIGGRGQSGGQDVDQGTEQSIDPQAGLLNVKLENGVQIANMKQDAYGFTPNNFVVKKGLPVRWVINATDLNSCSSSIYASKLGINKYLKLGENVLEFTPEETGTIRFSCGMGMYPGEFRVI